MIPIVDALQRAAPDSWAYAEYLAKLERELERGLLRTLVYTVADPDGAQLHRLLELLSRIPEGGRLVDQHREDLVYVVKELRGSFETTDGRPSPSWPAARRLAQALLEAEGSAPGAEVNDTSR